MSFTSAHYILALCEVVWCRPREPLPGQPLWQEFFGNRQQKKQHEVICARVWLGSSDDRDREHLGRAADSSDFTIRSSHSLSHRCYFLFPAAAAAHFKLSSVQCIFLKFLSVGTEEVGFNSFHEAVQPLCHPCLLVCCTPADGWLPQLPKILLIQQDEGQQDV